MTLEIKSPQNNSESTHSADHPYVTVTMPICNEERYIARSLTAVLQQDYPEDKMEVIIADGMSIDNTRHVISEMKAKYNIPVTVLDNAERIVPTGMNIAIRKAKGDIIVRVDGHTIVEPDYVRQCVEILKQSGADNVGGPMRAVGEGYIAKGISLATSTPFGLGNSRFHYSDQEQFVDTVYMGAFRKEVLFKVGLFDEDFVRHQDYEINYRIRKNGGKIFLSPKIRSVYFARTSLLKLCRQYLQYGYWKGKLLRRSPDSLKWRHTVPPLFILILAIGIVFSLMVSKGFNYLLILLTCYTFFLIAATVIVCKISNIIYSLILPPILVIIHLCWGVGVWWGLISSK